MDASPSSARHGAAISWKGLGEQRFWLILAPLAALVCTFATWGHYWLSGGLRLQEYPRGPPLIQMSLVAAVGLLLLGACCFAVYRRGDAGSLKHVYWSALGVHVGMLLALPLYSTDTFSYLLYGELSARGLNPHFVGPSALHDAALVGLTTWKDKTSVYGPFSDLMMSVAGHVGHSFGSPIWVNGICYKLLTGFFDVACLSLLYRRIERDSSPNLVRGFALFALNPLLAWEVAAHAHNDGLVVAFAVFFLLANERGRQAAAVTWLTLGTLSKFVLAPTLVLHLATVARSKFRHAVQLGLLALLIFVVFYGPLYWESRSLASLLPTLREDYFGSIYSALAVALRAVHAPVASVHVLQQVFVWVGRAVVLLVIGVTFSRTLSVRDVPQASLLLLLAVLCTSLVLAPWYLTWLIPFAAVEADRRWQDLVLGMTLLCAPSLAHHLSWLVLPLCQAVGLFALFQWMPGFSRRSVLDRLPRILSDEDHGARDADAAVTPSRTA